MQKRIRTLEDIARLAGVSKSTVSRALSDSPLISQQTKDKVTALAREHKFQIHQPARRLSLQQSSTIGFVTHGQASQMCIEDLFQMEMLSSISRALADHHYDLLMLQVDPYDTTWASEYIHTGRVDGFILMTSTRKQHHIQSLLDMQAPFIIWGIPQPRQNFCTVTGDNFSGGRKAAEHLIQQGRRRIAFLGGPDDELEVQLRRQGYEAALESAGMPLDPSLIHHGSFSSAAGAGAVRRLLAHYPDIDGIAANSDLMAIGAIAALQELDRRVPEDVSVVGYDDLSITRYTTPPLTTISQHIPDAGRLLVNNLVQFLQTGVVTNVVVPVELVVRGSS